VKSTKTDDGYDIQGFLSTNKANWAEFVFYLPSNCSNPPYWGGADTGELLSSIDFSFKGHVSPTKTDVTFTISNCTMSFDEPTSITFTPLLTFAFSGTAWAGNANLVASGDTIATEGENKYVAPPKPKSTFSLKRYTYLIIVIAVIILAVLCAICLQCSRNKRRAQGVLANKVQQSGNEYPMPPVYFQQQQQQQRVQTGQGY
jgi:hypothetical protein